MLETLEMLFRLFAFTCPCSQMFIIDLRAVLSARLRHILMSDYFPSTFSLLWSVFEIVSAPKSPLLKINVFFLLLFIYLLKTFSTLFEFCW